AHRLAVRENRRARHRLRPVEHTRRDGLRPAHPDRHAALGACPPPVAGARRSYVSPVSSRAAIQTSTTPWYLREQTALQNGSRLRIATGGRSSPQITHRPSLRTFSSFPSWIATCRGRSSSAASS